MNTKIANGLIIFLSIICVVMLTFLAYHNFFPPVTVRKSKTFRKTDDVTNEQAASPVVLIQTRSILRGLKDSSVDGMGYLMDSSGIILTDFHQTAHTARIIATVAPGHFYRARKIVEDPRHNIALFQLEQPQIGLPEMPLARPWTLKKKRQENFLVSYLEDKYSKRKEIKVLEQYGSMPLFQLENVLAKYLIPERMRSMSFGFVPGMTAEGKIVVVRVFRRSPAYRAGIRRGMTITSFQEWDPTHDLMGLSRRMLRMKDGEPVKIQLVGAGNVTVKPISFSHCQPSLPIFWKLGIFVRNMDPVQIKKSGFPFESGVMVLGNSFPYDNFFRRGDMIVKWNRKTIRSVDDLKQEIQNAPIGTYAFALVYSVVDKPGEGRFLVKRVQPVIIR